MDLRAYIDELEKARERKRAALSPEDLREIITELGWTDADLAGIEVEVQAHLERARNYVTHSLWDNALSELRKASALAPTRLAIWTDLASAHFGRFQATNDFSDLDAVEEYANRCLELEPGHHTSYALLAGAEKARKAETKGSTGGTGIRLLAVGLLLLAGIGAGMYVAISPDPMPDKSPGTETVVHHLPKDVKQVGGPVVSDTAKVEVQFDVDSTSGLELVPKRVTQNDYDSGSFFVYSALLKNAGKNEFTKLKGRLELVGEDGANLAVSTVTFLDTHNGTMRPGDVQVISSTVKSQPGVKLARFKVEVLDFVPAPPEYPALIPVPLIWDIPRPPSTRLDFFERKTTVGNPKDAIAGLAFFKTEWELRNVGEQTLRSLKLEYRLIDTNDKVIDSATIMVAYSATPEISPGESRVVFGIKQLKVDNFARYEIHVIEAE